MAQLTTEPNLSGPELLYLTTDHLGTPVLATTPTGQPTWAGGLEPFGRVWTAGGNPDPEPGAARGTMGLGLKALGRLSAESVFLRYPGQWASDAFRLGGVQGDVYYNLHRWYQTGTGRYAESDPFQGSYDPAQLAYSYSSSNPVTFADPLGLATVPCENCKTIEDFLAKMIRVRDNLRATGSVSRQGERFTRIAGSGCRETANGPLGFTRFFAFPFLTHPCIHTCIGDHERVHRQQCRKLGVERYFATPDAVLEPPAYDAVINCLRKAREQGRLTLSTDGFHH